MDDLMRIALCILGGLSIGTFTTFMAGGFEATPEFGENDPIETHDS